MTVTKLKRVSEYICHTNLKKFKFISLRLVMWSFNNTGTVRIFVKFFRDLLTRNINYEKDFEEVPGVVVEFPNPKDLTRFTLYVSPHQGHWEGKFLRKIQEWNTWAFFLCRSIFHVPGRDSLGVFLGFKCLETLHFLPKIKRYPHDPPKVSLETVPIYHPNINYEGKICCK